MNYPPKPAIIFIFKIAQCKGKKYYKRIDEDKKQPVINPIIKYNIYNNQEDEENDNN